MSRMKYDIKDDVVFKTIFGQNNDFSKKVLKSMVEAFISIPIESLEFMPNEVKDGNLREKQTIGDIVCIFKDGTRAQIYTQERIFEEGAKAGREEGKKEGKELGKLESIQSLMKTMNWSIEQVMEALSLSVEEKEKYRKLME